MTATQETDGEQLGFVEGCAFLATGAALVIHILVDLPLWLAATTTVALAALVIELARRRHPDGLGAGSRQIRVGLAAAVVAVVAYDVSRLALREVFDLQVHPFKAFEHFGAGLIGRAASVGAQQVAGTAFHIVNGLTFGVTYAIWAGRRGVWWGIAFGLGLEAVMLALYPAWLQIPNMREFTSMSIFGHVAYGATLGLLARRWLGGPRPVVERLRV